VKVLSIMSPRPRVENWSQRGLVRLTENLSGAFNAGPYGTLMLHLGAGLWSDGASVPNILWGVLDATPLQLLTMALFHDGGYRKDAVWTLPNGSTRPIERSAADDMAEAVAGWSGASWYDGRKIRYGLGAGASGSFHKKDLLWEPT